VSIFTETLGLQSYLVNSVRTSSKKNPGKAGMFQPTAILDLVVYHSELKQLQRIKEFKWGYLYKNVLTDVLRNAVAVFMIELLGKCLKQPEANPELFYFVEDAFTHLDIAQSPVMANFPLFFALHLPNFFGFRIPGDPEEGTLDEEHHYFLDLQEGEFVTTQPQHPHFLEGKPVFIISQLLKVRHPGELADIKLNHEFRRVLMSALERYYALHVQDFGTMRTVPVLRELLS
jgi:DNA repair protein RecO (recombination protein O)